MIKEEFLALREAILSYIPAQYQFLLPLFLLTILIVIYSIIIFKFYIFQSRRDIIKLNLSKYNTSKHPITSKFFAIVYYMVEYLIFVPILSGVWFIFLAIFLVILSKNQTLSEILMVTAALVASIRVTAYFTEDLSKDLAKMIPFILLGLFILGENFFNLNLLIERISELPSLLPQIPYYLLFIFSIEFIMRMITLFTNTGDNSE